MIFTQIRRQMKAIIIVVAVTFVASLAYVGGSSLLSANRGESNKLVAEVNGEKIRAAQVDKAFQQTVQYWEQVQGRVSPTELEGIRANALESLITNTMILQAGKKEKIKVSRKEINDRLAEIKGRFPSVDDYKRQLQVSNLTESELRKLIRESLVVEKLQEKLTTDIKVTDADVAKAYEEIQASHILVKPDGDSEAAWAKAKDKAEKILQQVKAGSPFAELAKKESQDPVSAPQGGDLGFFGPGKMVPEFEKAAFALPVGGTSDLVKSSFGYHIIKVTGRKEAKGAEFDKAKAELKVRLLDEKKQETLTKWFAGLKEKAKIQVIDPALAGFRLAEEGKAEEALPLYQKALAEQPDQPYLHYSLGILYQQLKKDDQAITQFEEAIKKGANDPNVYVAVGLAYKEKGDNAKATERLQKASDLDPNNFQLHLNLYTLFKQMGNEQAAKVEEGKLLQIQKAMEEQQKLQQQLQQQQEEAAQKEPESQQDAGEDQSKATGKE